MLTLKAWPDRSERSYENYMWRACACNVRQHLNKDQHNIPLACCFRRHFGARMLLATAVRAHICFWLHVFRFFCLCLRHFLSYFFPFVYASTETCIELLAAYVDCTFFPRSIKCLCKARRTWTYMYEKPEKGNKIYTIYVYTHIRTLSYISDSKFICCVFSSNRSIVVSRKNE